jgi:DNA-binding SARP family transcriptional activator
MLRVSLLGEQAITRDGTGVQLRSSRGVALVAFLVVHAGVPQARERIAGLFWPESADGQALTNLRHELHYLRQVLADEPSLVVTSRDLCWRDTETCRVDVRVFDGEREAALDAVAAGDGEGVLVHAARAIGEYRGDFLPGGYEDWLLEARSELERRYVEVCDLLCQTRARRGDVAGAADAARRRIRVRPLEEVGYRTLMQLQADLGDRAGAVSTFHHCASVLERELGIAPDRATRQVFRRVLAADDPAGAAAAAAVIEPAVRRSGFVAARLVGRSGELGLLRDLWQAAVAGRPGLALVRGGAGVGKTRLVAEITEVARRQGAVVASSQCFGASGRVALAPVADWLRNPSVRSAAAALEEVWRAEVDRLVPAEGRADRAAGPEAAPGPGAVAGAWQRHRFFEGLARALLAVGRPMMLVLDNMQWCDLETLDFVAFCLGLAPGTQILVTGTVRDDPPDEDPGLAAWAGTMRATGLLTEISLSPFEAADTAALAAVISGRPLAVGDRNLLQALTGGFPLYVIEAMRSTVDTGAAPAPARDLSAVLRSRLDQATAAARDVAGLAAAVGTDFPLDLLTEASDLDTRAVVGAVDELWRRRILREFGDGYDFSHDLLRDAAYAQVSPPKRWLLHRRIAQAIELVHADDLDLVSVQLAEQYARGGRPRRAVAYYQRAADAATGVFAHAEAVRLCKEALAIIGKLPAGKDRDRQELAVLEAMAVPLNVTYGHASPELEQAAERSITLARSIGRTASMSAAMFVLWGAWFVQGRIADSHQIAGQALALADPGSEGSSWAHFAVGASSVSLGMPAAGLRHFELSANKAGDMFSAVGDQLGVSSLTWAAHAHWLLGHDDDALAARQRAVKTARAIDHPYNLAVALAYGAVVDQMRRDHPGIRDALRELRELCDRYDFAYYREWGLILDGWSRGDEPGIELAERGISNLKAEGSFTRMPYWLSLLADLQARNNRPDAARATLDAAAAAAQARDDVWWLPEVMRMRAAYDQDQAAISRLRSAAQLASAHGSVALIRRCERDLAERDARPIA